MTHIASARPALGRRLALALAIVVGLGIAASPAAAESPGAGRASILAPAAAAAAVDLLSPEVRSQLAAVRAATAKYRNPSRAVLDGYRLVPGRGCVDSASGSMMGFHFVNVRNLLDGRDDLANPDYLLYAPAPGGGFALAGVEWEQADVGQAAPKLFGRKFDGPMAGHVPGQARHYDIHVWVQSPNPSGTFARYNPALSCCPPEHHRPPRRARPRRCVNDDQPVLGAGRLSPGAVSVRPGATARWEMAWTHPDDWTRIDELTLRVKHAGREVARVAYEQGTGVLRSTGSGVRLVAGESGASGDHPRGRRVTVRVALRLPRRLAGRRLSAQVVMRDDAGHVQRAGGAGTVTVRPG